MSNNTLLFELRLRREALKRGGKTLDTAVTLENVKEVLIVEQTLAAGAVAVPINFGPVANADAIVIFTPKKVGLHINGVGAPEVTCDSEMVIPSGANITSLHIDNDLIAAPGEAITVEVWLIAVTD